MTERIAGHRARNHVVENLRDLMIEHKWGYGFFRLSVNAINIGRV